ncbi:MAG: biotin--[acetyl-CoA-carboxylase] ligase [Defluviitaleaceae bacterium]|nr:biotin--[acetyl-CoA-carboxylase] ligase [Defluviitaleaceae bacterium]
MKTKDYILALLEENRGKSISGEFLASKLNVSRTAVWKAIKELEKGGYKITASTNKGYCLTEENDILSVQGITNFLLAPAEIIMHSSLDSTNAEAKRMAITNAKHGTVIIADHQTDGKGRYGRSFFSPKGHGIYMSFILHPPKIFQEVPTLVTIFAAVAVCEAIEIVCKKKPQIKWVNDIFLDGKKICGISTEAVTDLESGSIQWFVLGIGVNFTMPESGIPPEFEQTIGAIYSEKPNTARNYLAAEIINNISKLVRQNKTFVEKYRSRLMMLGEKITVYGMGKEYEATAIDIDEIGQLLVKTTDGEMHLLSSGEVSVKKG